MSSRRPAPARPTNTRPPKTGPARPTKAGPGGPSSTWKSYAILALGVLVVGAVIWVGATAQSPTDPNAAPGAGQNAGQAPQQQGMPDLARRDASDVTAVGAVDAPVVIIEYSDFRCPFCGVFSRDTMPRILETYVDSGQVRVERRDVPIFGEQSMDGALAARAAGEQGLFWEYTAAVYQAAPDRGHHELPREKLLDFAVQVGVPDLAKFAADMDRPDLAAAIDADTAEARSIGATSTPSFLVGDIPISGAQPYAVFEDAIDQKLAQAQP